MLTNTYKLQFFLLLLARVSKGDVDCLSFLDVMAFDRNTSGNTSVLSAPGFVESLTIPSWSQDELSILEPIGNATAKVTSYGPDGAGTTRFLDYRKTITVRVPGTGSWAGFNASANRPFGQEKGVNWNGFMRYFADGGVGVVIDLENHSTLLLSLELSQNTTVYTAQPEKMYKVAIAVQYESVMEITIQSANVISISMVDLFFGENPYYWLATDNGISLAKQTFGEWGHTERVTTPKHNQCLDVKMYNGLQGKTLVPTQSPTTASAAATHRGTVAAFSLLVAASLALY